MANKVQRERYLTGLRTASISSHSIIRDFDESSKPLAVVVWRRDHAGLMSLIGTILRGFQYAKWLGATPVVDLEHFSTAYSEKAPVGGKNNVWEYYFDQPAGVRLTDLQEGKFRVILTNGSHPHISGSHDEDDYRVLWREFVRFNDTTQAYLDQTVSHAEISAQTIGVHFRAGDMRFFPGHPLPPTFEQIAGGIEKLLQTGHYTNILLATQDDSDIGRFRRKFGSMLDVLPIFRPATQADRRATPFSGSYRAGYPPPRAQHLYQLGREVLAEAYGLSKAGALVAGSSNVALMSRVMRQKPHQDQLWIWNGWNSRNPIAARFKWWAMDLLPESRGGFRAWSESWVHQPGSPGPT